MCYLRGDCGPMGYRGPLRAWEMGPGFHRWSPRSRPYPYKRTLEEYARELEDELAWVEEEMKEGKETRGK